MNKIFNKYEKKLRMNSGHIVRKTWDYEETIVKMGKAEFIVPRPPKQEVTFRWKIERPTAGNEAPRPYTVKWTPHVGKRAKIPETMYNMKRSFPPRRDARIHLSDATFQPIKKITTPEIIYTAYNPPDVSEKELRAMEDFKSFFESWDEDCYTEDECLELIENAVLGRIETYQEIYKQTSNPLYLGRAVFLKFLDLDRLSDLHKLYLILSEECEFPMWYVEGALRKHYDEDFE